jgi:hypothetical protein
LDTINERLDNLEGDDSSTPKVGGRNTSLSRKSKKTTGRNSKMSAEGEVEASYGAFEGNPDDLGGRI